MSDILTNIERWSNNVHKDKNSQDLKETALCTIIVKNKIHRPNGK